MSSDFIMIDDHNNNNDKYSRSTYSMHVFN